MGFRQGYSAAESADCRPTTSAVLVNSTDRAWETTPRPDASTINFGYTPVGFNIRKVLRILLGYGRQIPLFSQVGAPFPLSDAAKINSGV